MGKLQILRSVTLGLLVCLLGIIQLGCGGGNQGSIQSFGGRNDGGSFTFQALPESLVDQASSEFTNNVIRTDSAVTVEVNALGATGLKALYFELGYDPEEYHPVAVEYTELLGETADLLTIDLTNLPGRVICGQVLKNYPELEGFTGSGTLATVRFEKGAAPRSASVPPTSSSSKVIPHFVAPGVVSWLYTNTGDYDQNKEVNVADLTPIALNYGTQGPFDPESGLWMVDGDSNGEINLADITPIAINYESTVTSYQLMSSPASPGGEPIMMGSIDFENAISEPGRRLSFLAEIVGSEGGTPDVRSASYFSILDPDMGFYWDYDTNVVVVPFDATEDGIASDPFFDAPSPDDVILALDNPPTTGTGHFTDPYILSQGDDLGGNPLSFRMTHPSAGNVTNSVDTGFFANTANFGDFSSSTPGLFEFTVPSTQTGAFHIYAVNNGKLGYPPAIYFVMLPSDVVPPVLALTNPPTEGSGTQADPYVADVTAQYIFSLISDGTDVSTDSGARYFTSPPQVGYVSARDARLDITDGFVGLLDISATYFGTANTPASNVYMQVGGDYTLASDTLYAIPQQSHAQVGEPVSIVVATGVPANPFQFMNAVGLTVEAGMEYVEFSFNVGDIGGAANDVDGIWPATNPTGPGNFILAPDSFYFPDDIGGERERWSFNVTPLGAIDVTSASGNLFNIQVSFPSPGTYTFGFQEFEGIKRTFYSDNSATENYWGDITNNHPGVLNSIIVSAGPEPPVLTLTNPPAQGDGSTEDPYIADVATDYVFSLIDPIDGDVSLDPQTTYSLTDPLAGFIDPADATLYIEDSYTGTFYVSGEYGGTESGSICMGIGGGGSMEPDTLYAIPQETDVGVGDPVTVLVKTGVLSSSFQFMLGVGLTIDDDASYVPNSFNVGAIGGARKDVDGIWAGVNPTNFILGPDELIQPGADPEGTLFGRDRYDLNVSPLGGIDIDSGEGDLCNLQFSFSEPGEKTFGFQVFNGVDRTYYNSQSDGTSRFWSDTTNDHPGFANSVTVTPGPALPVLVLTNPPLLGDGSVSDPFVADVVSDYLFSLTDPTEGDVTNDPLTLYMVSEPSAGSIDTADATLNIEDPYVGTFNVVAEYMGLLSNSVYLTVGAGGLLDPDTLYAIPMQSTVAVGEPVTVLVKTGAMASSFQFLTGCGLTIDDDASYVPMSFNVGAIGGAADDVDGIWVAVNPTGDPKFLLPPDFFYVPGSDPDGTLIGRFRFDINVTPFGGIDIDNGEGDLFNMQFSFSEAGEKVFGFQLVNGVDRTFYANVGDGTPRYWSDITNDHPGFANSVTVTEP